VSRRISRRRSLDLITSKGDHGRGLHRHAPDDNDRLRLLQLVASHTRGGNNRVNRPPPQPTMPTARHANIDLSLSAPLLAVSILPKVNP